MTWSVPGLRGPETACLERRTTLDVGPGDFQGVLKGLFPEDRFTGPLYVQCVAIDLDSHVRNSLGTHKLTHGPSKSPSVSVPDEPLQTGDAHSPAQLPHRGRDDALLSVRPQGLMKEQRRPSNTEVGSGRTSLPWPGGADVGTPAGPGWIQSHKGDLVPDPGRDPGDRDGETVVTVLSPRLGSIAGESGAGVRQYACVHVSVRPPVCVCTCATDGTEVRGR